ncbi:MAG: hypothetical protein ACXVJE_19235 [Mucilaginibacter sp.]
MEDRFFLLVKCTVKTKYKYIHEAIQELQDGTTLQLTITPNVNVQHAEIIKMNTQSSKN